MTPDMRKIVESFNAKLECIYQKIYQEINERYLQISTKLREEFMVKIEELQEQQAIKTRKLSQKKQNSIIALKQLGWTNAEIANMLDIDEKTIESSEDFLKYRQSVIELRKKGWAVEEIARSFKTLSIDEIQMILELEGF